VTTLKEEHAQGYEHGYQTNPQAQQRSGAPVECGARGRRAALPAVPAHEEDLKSMYEAYVRRPQTVRVLGMRASGQPLEVLRIVNAHVAGDGTQVVVALPPDKKKC